MLVQWNFRKVAPRGNASVVHQQLEITDFNRPGDGRLHALGGTEIGDERLNPAALFLHLGCKLIEAVPSAGDSDNGVTGSHQLLDEDVAEARRGSGDDCPPALSHAWPSAME